MECVGGGEGGKAGEEDEAWGSWTEGSGHAGPPGLARIAVDRVFSRRRT